jgi:hypothetical protein
MNRTYALALSVSCAAAGAAYADDITIEPHPFISVASRAQVLDDLHLYQRPGVNPWADDYHPARRADGTLTRAQVTAEFMAARNLVAAFSGEDSGSDYLTRLAAARARPGAVGIARAQ